VSGWSAERVAEAANAWVWVPQEARRVDRDYLLVDFPPGYDDECPTQVQWTRSDRPPDEVVDEAVEQTRAWGRDRLGWWIRLDTRPASVRETLIGRGAIVHETVAVLARGLGSGLDDLPSRPLRVRAELVRDEATLRDARTVYREVWGGPEPTPEQRRRDLAEASLPVAEREAFQVVAYVDDEPASAGGCTLSGDVARLWGAATRPAYRGRGCYRETVRARLELAARHGATLGLVKGRLATSGPILTRLGFTAYGEEPLLMLDLSSRRGPGGYRTA